MRLRNMIKKYKWLVVLCMMIGLLVGCAPKEAIPAEGSYDVYYINLNETALVKDLYEAVNSETEQLIPELIGAMSILPVNPEHFNLLDENVKVDNYQYDGSNVELNMSAAYGELPKTKEVLVRAGLVRTLIQIEGVNTVSFLVAGQPLCDSKGNPIGQLEARSFIENSGKEINSYKSVNLTLYFTNELGTELVEESRSLYFSSNVSIEQVVIEQLLKGPKSEGIFPTLPAEAKVMSVTTVDRTCYVNFDETFSTAALNVQEFIPIYSIVNSIIENCSVHEVQISINGESDLIFRENMKLAEFYTMNRDLIRKE